MSGTATRATASTAIETEIPPGDRRAPTIPWAGVFHLTVLYVVWSSTYLAMRLGVREGGGFPPFTMGALRFLAAGALLLMGAALARQRLAAAPRDLGIAGITGILMWVGGNGLVLCAEQRADSGYAAVVIGTTPMWVALVESIIDRQAHRSCWSSRFSQGSPAWPCSLRRPWRTPRRWTSGPLWRF